MINSEQLREVRVRTQTRIAVIAVEPTGKAFFVYSYVKTRLMG